MRIFSGINPSSNHGLHIGNYFGAVRPQVDLQSKGECFYFVANLHSLNTVFDPNEIKNNTLNIFTEYISLGIDPEKSTFFVESDIPEIAYFQTILNNCVTVSELKRMHGYKDKLTKVVDQDTISAGLFEYPVLMSADILAFNPDIVPVGEDQSQHVEICREIARTFNNRYGNVLKIPELSVQKNVGRVVGTDGIRKMSKSIGNDISIFAPESAVKKQIRSITTDPSRIKPTDPGDPTKNICFTYLRLLGHQDELQIEELESRYRSGTVKDVEIKSLVEESFHYVFSPYRARKEELMENPSLIVELRQKGMEKARKVAKESLLCIKQACGI